VQGRQASRTQRAAVLVLLAVALVLIGAAIGQAASGGTTHDAGSAPVATLQLAGASVAPPAGAPAKKKHHRKKGGSSDQAAAQTPSDGSAQTGSRSGAGCPAGQFTNPAGYCQSIPSRYGGSPPAHSPEGERKRRETSDCEDLPPPPPGYDGPVQC
jgi:hypothetical protein